MAWICVTGGELPLWGGTCLLAADIKCLTRVVEVPKQRRRGNNDAMPGEGTKAADFAEKTERSAPQYLLLITTVLIVVCAAIWAC